MNNELKKLLDEVDLNDISDLDDITAENVDEILSKYDLDNLRVEENSGERMLDEAYAKVYKDNDKKNVSDLHSEIDDEAEVAINSNSSKDNDVDYDIDSILDEDYYGYDTTNDSNKKSGDSSFKEDMGLENLGIDSVGLKNLGIDVDNIDIDNIDIDKMDLGNVDIDNLSDEKLDDYIENIGKKSDKEQDIKENIINIKEDNKSKEVINKENKNDKDNKYNKKNKDNKNNKKNKDVDNKSTIIDNYENGLDNEKEENTKKSLFERISDSFKKLFYNVQDPEYEKQQRKLERKELRKKENLAKEKEKAKEQKLANAEEKKKKAAEEAAAKKKEKEELNRKKAEEKKKAAEKKKKEKEEKKKALENEPVGRINKLGATVVFMFVGLILAAIILYATKGLKTDYTKKAYEYFSQGNYELAYLTLIKDKNLKKDSEFYEQVKLVQGLNKQLSYFSSNIALLERNKALDALLKGIEIYDENKVYAKRLSVDKEYDQIFDEIKKYLKEEFDLNIGEARGISQINNEEEYSEKIDEVCKATKK